MDVRGYCDVAYHFFVFIDGTVWEGRPLEMPGAHVGGHNTGNIGIAFVGCFHDRDCASFPPNEPPEAMIEAGVRAIGVLAPLFEIPIDESTVRGHRDHPDQRTACPGDHLHAQLGAMRELASALSPPDEGALADGGPPDAGGDADAGQEEDAGPERGLATPELHCRRGTPAMEKTRGARPPSNCPAGVGPPVVGLRPRRSR